MNRNKKTLVLVFLTLVLTILLGCSGDKNTTSSPNNKTAAQFVGSIFSKEYHYPSCELAQKIKYANEIWFTTAEDAKAKGYDPCKVCSPP